MNIELSQATPKEMVLFLEENMQDSFYADDVVDIILKLIDARILNGDSLYWNEVLKELE